MALTRRQKQVLDFLRGFLVRHGYVPSYEEIARGLHLRSTATVHKHLATLQAKGYLHRQPHDRRSLELLNPESAQRRARRHAHARHRLPLLGRIAAGRPIEAIEARASISLADIAGSRPAFALEVRGDSMVDEHIVEGDFVLVERTETADDGDLVIALIDGSEATLKRLYREAEEIRLQPSNSRLQPLRYPADRVRIQGRVLGVLRKF